MPNIDYGKQEKSVSNLDKGIWWLNLLLFTGEQSIDTVHALRNHAEEAEEKPCPEKTG